MENVCRPNATNIQKDNPKSDECCNKDCYLLNACGVGK